MFVFRYIILFFLIAGWSVWVWGLWLFYGLSIWDFSNCILLFCKLQLNCDKIAAHVRYKSPYICKTTWNDEFLCWFGIEGCHCMFSLSTFLGPMAYRTDLDNCNCKFTLVKYKFIFDKASSSVSPSSLHNPYATASWTFTPDIFLVELVFGGRKNGNLNRILFVEYHSRPFANARIWEGQLNWTNLSSLWSKHDVRQLVLTITQF